MTQNQDAVPTVVKSFMQSTLAGSVLFASDVQGKMLRYAERDVWGSLKVPSADMDTTRVEQNLRFTTFSYDPVRDKQFAYARFYDASQGRMLSKDPVKRGQNPYPYCDNDPVNYVDPTGEIANILAGGRLGGVIGGAFGFAGSAASQLIHGEKFDIRKAAGVAGDALEQSIGTGKVDIGRSVTSGLTNAASGAIYGNGPLKNAGDALLRGAGAGAAGINNLSNAWRNKNGSGNANGYQNGNSLYPYGANRDSRICSVPNPFADNIGYTGGRGYQYGSAENNQKNGFSLSGFFLDVGLGAIFGGTSSALFYIGGKVVESLTNSVKNPNQTRCTQQNLSEGGTDSTRVGRWMSEDEYQKMIDSGSVQMSGDNKVHVANPADINAFGKQAPNG